RASPSLAAGGGAAGPPGLRPMGDAGPRRAERRAEDPDRDIADAAGGRLRDVAIVPRPFAVASQAEAARMPVLRRDEFPIAVRPENDLRFGSDQTTAAGAATTPRDGPAAPETAGPIPLAARRVP